MDYYSGFIILALMPICAGVLFLLLSNKNLMHIISMAVSVLLIIPYLFLANGVIKYGSISEVFIVQFYMDGLNTVILGLVLLVVLVTNIYNIGFLNENLKNKRFAIKKIKSYYVLFYAFLWTMILTLITGNMGQMWIFIEATTLASAFLVGMYNDKKSLEAAWKYIIICSVGIAMALLGVIFLHIASKDIVKGTGSELNWVTIYNNISNIDADLIRLSFIFMLVGFGTKAGLAPMNTWLPDSYSQAPAPVSAVLSGCLSNISMYALIREIAIVNKALGSSMFTGKLMFIFGLFSMLIAAVFIINQKDYKRLLAYSSIEHMGIVAFGLGVFTPAAVLASILHMINHSLTKTMLFLASGNIVEKFGTKKIARVKGLMKTMPLTGGAFVLGIFAITGMPPFSIFTSELSMIISGFESGHKYKTMALVLLVAVVFVGFAMTSFKMFYGKAQNTNNGKNNGKCKNITGSATVGALLALITITGLYMPTPIYNLISMAQKIVTGG